MQKLVAKSDEIIEYKWFSGEDLALPIRTQSVQDNLVYFNSILLIHMLCN